MFHRIKKDKRKQQVWNFFPLKSFTSFLFLPPFRDGSSPQILILSGPSDCHHGNCAGGGGKVHHAGGVKIHIWATDVMKCSYNISTEYQFPVRRILLMDSLKPEVRSVGVPAHCQQFNIRQPDPRYLQVQYTTTCSSSLPFVLVQFYSQGCTPGSSIMLDPLSLRSHFVSGQCQNMGH